MADQAANRRVNADDVAQLAQVSRSAVSRTFTPGASVAPDTRARVLAAAKTLNYQPTQKSAQAKTARRPTIAIIMANLLSPYFGELADRLNDELSAKDYRALFLISSDLGRIDGLVTDALAREAAGIIIFSAVPQAKTMAAAQAAGVPVVILNHRERVEGASLVWIDAPEAGRAVAKLMLAEGRRRPAVLMATSFRSRELEAFAETMEAGGSEPCRWLEVGWSYEAGQRAGDTLFTQGERPDAVFAAADNPAIGLLDAARTRYGLRVPSDLSVVGFGNTAPAAWDANRLSSVRLPIGSLIQTAVATLLARLASADEPAPRIWLGCDIVERGTSLTRDL